MTWNVDSLSSCFTKRYDKITETINNEQPDIIAFQEANIIFSKELEKKEYNEYYKSSYCGALKTLSKYPIIYQECYVGITLQFRPVLITDILVNHANIRVINVHLDSFSYSQKIRIRQLKKLNERIEGYKNIIYMGDFNFTDQDKEIKIIDSTLKDIWKYLYPNTDGYTWNMYNNYMALENSSSGDITSRLDRIYMKGDFSYSDMYLIGKEPIEAGLWPSDHFGLVVNVGLYDLLQKSEVIEAN
jgi:endonuclease/exonuclease/phosphatase family metal-dependent hydrolase